MDKQKERILILISTLRTAGAERLAGSLSIQLSDAYDIDFLLNNTEEENLATEHNGTIISLDMKHEDNRDKLSYQIKLFFKRMRTVRRLKKQNGYRACISFMPSADTVNILTSCKGCLSIPHVVNTMSARSNNVVKNILIHTAVRFVYRRAPIIVAQTIEQRDDLVNNFGISSDKIVVIYSRVDTELIARRACEELPDDLKEFYDSHKVFVTAGRNTFQKGQWHLIRAFADVYRKHSTAGLVIFGEGPMREELVRLSEDSGLSDVIVFHDNTSMLESYISHSSGFIFPSLYEGFPLALETALSCGVPCVASDFPGGAREMLGGCNKGETDYERAEYGIITATESDNIYAAEEPLDVGEKSLASAMNMLLEDEETSKHYSRMAKVRSRDYDISVMKEDWLRLLNES